MQNILIIENCAVLNGGSWLSSKAIIDGLPKAQFKPLIVFTSPRFNGYNLNIEYQYKIIPKKEINLRLFRTVGLLLDLLFFTLPHSIRLALLIKRHKIPFVHLNNNIYAQISAIIAAKISNVPCICHIRSSRYPILRIEKFFSMFIDKIIAISEENKKDLVKNGLEEKKIAVVYDPIDLGDHIISDIERLELKTSLGIGENDFCIGIFSRISIGKGHETFIKAAFKVLEESANTNIKFLIIGEAVDYEKSYEDKLLDWVEEKGYSSNVFFLGYRADILKIVQVLDVVVDVSSLPEGLRRTVVEAMLLNKPVIVTGVDPLSRAIRDGEQGFLVEPGDYLTLASKIVYLSQNKGLALEVGLAGKRLVSQNYNYDESLKRIKDLYYSLGAKRDKAANILFFEPSSGFGGSSGALFNLLNNINRSFFNPFVIILVKGPQFEKMRALNITIRKIKPNLLSQIYQLIFLIRKFKINLIHINTNIISGIPAIIASKLAGKPCICHIRQTRKLIKRERFFVSWVNKFIVLNKDAYEILKKDIPEKKLSLVYDGLDLDGYKSTGINANVKNELNLDGASCIGIVGRLVEGKGHDDFIKAAYEVIKKKPNAKFIIIGSDPNIDKQIENKLRNLTDRLNLNGNLIFTGWRNDVFKIISALDFTVQPYTSPEGLPNVIIEAMALAKAVISTNIPGPSDILVDGETGFLVPTGDINVLSEKILYLLDHPDVALEMGEKGRKRAEEVFDIKFTAEKIQKIYSELLDRN